MPTPPTTTLDVWLAADVGFTPSSWADQSGNGNNVAQATGGNQAALTANALAGLPAVTFNGATSRMTSAYSVSGAKTIAWIRRIAVLPGSAAFYCPWALQGPGSIQSSFDYSGVSSGFKTYTWKHDVALTAAGVGANVTLDTLWHADIQTFNAGTNTSVGSYTESVDNAAQTVVADGTYNPRTGITLSAIGCDLTSSNVAASFFNGQILDFLAYHSVLGASDMAQLMAYATWRLAGGSSRAYVIQPVALPNPSVGPMAMRRLLRRQSYLPNSLLAPTVDMNFVPPAYSPLAVNVGPMVLRRRDQYQKFVIIPPATADAAGQADGTSTAAATIGGSIDATGESDGAGTAAAAATGTAAAAGESDGNSTAAGAVTGTAAATGSSAGTSTAAATIGGSIQAAGASAGSATAALAAGASIGAAGEADGAGTASAAVTGAAAASGSSPGAASATAAVTGSISGAGSSGGTSSATAAATSSAGVTGSSGGTGTAAGVVTGSVQAAGEADGTSTASATLTIPSTSTPTIRVKARPQTMSTAINAAFLAIRPRSLADAEQTMRRALAALGLRSYSVTSANGRTYVQYSTQDGRSYSMTYSFSGGRMVRIS